MLMHTVLTLVFNEGFASQMKLYWQLVWLNIKKANAERFSIQRATVTANEHEPGSLINSYHCLVKDPHVD